MTTHDRVRRNTPADLNREIREDANRRWMRCATTPTDRRSDSRRSTREWDIERVLGARVVRAVALGIAWCAPGRRWLMLPLVVQSFFLRTRRRAGARRFPCYAGGFRSQQEIERERYTLRALLRQHVDIGVSDRPAEMPAQTSV